MKLFRHAAVSAQACLRRNCADRLAPFLSGRGRWERSRAYGGFGGFRRGSAFPLAFLEVGSQGAGQPLAPRCRRFGLSRLSHGVLNCPVEVAVSDREPKAATHGTAKDKPLRASGSYGSFAPARLEGKTGLCNVVASDLGVRRFRAIVAGASVLGGRYRPHRGRLRGRAVVRRRRVHGAAQHCGSLR
jgi:hypothetical protein